MKPQVSIAYGSENDLLPQILASTILVVDDNEINRIFLEKTLRNRGFTNIVCASSGEEALESIQGTVPEIILLDIIMPNGIDGYECCKLIRQQKKYKNLPILIQTSLTESSMRVEAFACGATDFVSKPVHPEELCARVMVHLENRHSLRTLQLYKSRIETELESARQLQLAVLPAPFEIEEMKSRYNLFIASYFEPSSEVGGDFWGVKNMFPHQSSIWLVDFSGHGVASALNAFRLHAYLKEYSPLAARPGEYLSYLNNKLLSLLLPGQFATMFYGIIDTQSNQLFFSCASMPSPFILRHGSGEVDQIDGSGTLLGIGLNLYPTQTISFNSGDRLFLCSDALLETPNAEGQYISEETIVALLKEHASVSVEMMKHKILEYFRRHAGNNLRDDLTIVICARSTM